MWTTTTLWGFIIWIVAAGLGAYLGSYFKEKGKNLATHEDIEKLVEQVSAVTAATKEIEARISNEVWDRQRRWELKRDILVDLARKAGRERQMIIELQSIYMTLKTAEQKDNPFISQRRLQTATNWNEAAGELEGALIIVTSLCGTDFSQTAYRFAHFMRTLSEEILNERLEDFTVASKQLGEWTSELTDAMRAELEIPPGP